MLHNKLYLDIPDTKIPLIKIDGKDIDYCDIITCLERKYKEFSPNTIQKYSNKRLITEESR